MTRRILFLSLAVLLVSCWASPAVAVSTVDCHCFRDREFSPQNPTAYDPYLLATVQNRLLAYAFAIPRKEIVRMKMTGSRGDLLWVSHWVAKVSTRSPAEVQTVFSKSLSWQKALAELSVNPEKLGSFFKASLAGDDEAALAWAVVMQVADQYTDNPEAFAALKERGASLKEAVLASILAALTETSAVKVFDRARQEGHWGSQLVSSGLAVESIDAFLKGHFPSR